MIPTDYEEYTHYMLVQRVLCLEKQLKEAQKTFRDEVMLSVLSRFIAKDQTYEMSVVQAYTVADITLEVRNGD